MSDPIVLDWRAPEHFARRDLPCRCCHRPTPLRDARGRPCHKVCAEAEILTLGTRS